MFRMSPYEAISRAHYRTSGVKIGVVLAGGYANPCFFDHSELQTCNPGISILIMEEVLDILKVPKEKRYYTTLSHTNYGLNGLLGEVKNGTFDTTLPYLAITPERRRHVLFSNPVTDLEELLISRYAQIGDRAMFDSFTAFTPIIWQVLILGAAILGEMIIFRSFALRKQKGNLMKSILVNSLDIISIFFGQGRQSDDHLNELSGRLALSGWVMSVVVIAGVYSDEILAKLIDRNVLPPFHDMVTAAECIQSGKCQMIHYTKSTSLFELLLK